MWDLLAALVAGGFSTFQQVRRHRADAVVSRAKRAAAGDDSATALDSQSVIQRGWKDEFLLIVTTLPLILCFIPDCDQFVNAGFDALDGVPNYYWYGLGMVYIDTFGFRRMFRAVMEQRIDMARLK